LKIGVTAQLNGTLGKVNPIDFAVAAEERGFESLWYGEHSHTPVATPWEWTEDGILPEEHKWFPDPFVTLAAAAAVTTTLRVGTAVSLLAEHQTFRVAKAVATLDDISGGRFEFGVAYGWNALETANNGLDPTLRRPVLREQVLALKRLWTQDTAAFHGEHISFDESWTYPKPVQRPHPPLHLGGTATPKNLAMVAELMDGWMPVVAAEVGLGDVDLAKHIKDVRSMAEGHGRDADAITFTAIAADGVLGGDAGIDAFKATRPTRDLIDRYAEVGVSRVIVLLPGQDPDTLLAALDEAADLCG
jgi:probable F420-dependent oxidoreductase